MFRLDPSDDGTEWIELRSARPPSPDKTRSVREDLRGAVAVAIIIVAVGVLDTGGGSDFLGPWTRTTRLPIGARTWMVPWGFISTRNSRYSLTVRVRKLILISQLVITVSLLVTCAVPSQFKIVLYVCLLEQLYVILQYEMS